MHNTTMSLSCNVSEIWPNIYRKSPILTYPTSIRRPLGMTPLEFRLDFWRQKIRIPWLSYGVVCVILCLAVLIQCRLVTGGRTDGRTDEHTTTAYTAP